MEKKETRAAILRAWLALPNDQRATDSQAAHFAERVQDCYDLPANDNSSLVIRRWLAPYVGLNPIQLHRGIPARHRGLS